MARSKKITTPFSKRTGSQRARIAMARGKRKGFARAARAARSPLRGLGGERRVPTGRLRGSLAREMNK
jgi:hypothetical protein